jgi:endoribonuclease LACTB2
LIIPLHAGNPGAMTGSGNWTYLVTGAVPVLIDAGVGTPDHLTAIATHQPDGPAHVIVTHAHPDHASGAEAIAQRWLQTRFWKFPWPGRDGKYRVHWNDLTDGQAVAAGDDQLEVIHTPGHAPDHICLWHPGTKTLFCGDLLVLGSTVVIPASAGGSLADYLVSLRRVDALGPAQILPAHGPRIEDSGPLIHEYINHRDERERQVLAAVSEGRATIVAIAEHIYVGLIPALHVMARETVLAHLQKLEAEGLVYHDGDRWLRASSM